MLKPGCLSGAWLSAVYPKEIPGSTPPTTSAFYLPFSPCTLLRNSCVLVDVWTHIIIHPRPQRVRTSTALNIGIIYKSARLTYSCMWCRWFIETCNVP